MTPAAFGYLFAAVLMNTAAERPLKAATNAPGVLLLARGEWPGTLPRIATQPHFVAGVTIYVVSLVVWIVWLVARA